MRIIRDESEAEQRLAYLEPHRPSEDLRHCKVVRLPPHVAPSHFSISMPAIGTTNSQFLRTGY